MGGNFKTRSASHTSATPHPPESGYRCICIDPPWNERGGGQIKRGADRHYPLMKTPDIIRTILCADVWHPAADAHLWLWVTDNHLPDGLDVIKALGFRFIRTMAWVKLKNYKLQVGMGQYCRGSHELCLLGVRGRTMLPAKAPLSVVMEERTQHSRKPDDAYETIEQVSPGPRLEMFARRDRPGWDCWGDEI